MPPRVQSLAICITLTMWLGSIGRDTIPTATAENTPPPAPIQAAYDQVVDRSATVGPSLNGLDRSHWGRTVVMPIADPGRSYPRYHHAPTWLGPRSRPAPLVDSGDVEIEAVRVTSHETNGVECRDWCDLAVQPLRFAADMVLMPVRLVICPPWTAVSHRHTPGAP
jgi:hypothetical protein